MESNSHCKLYFRYGVMNSGKSLFLCSSAYNFKERGIKFLILKSTIDTRDASDYIKSRALKSQFKCIPVDPETNVFDLISEKGKDCRWILVDEAQFMQPEQIDQLADVVDKLQINVICYGLRTDFRTELFPGSKRLFEIADSFEELKSTCECGRRASVNARISNDGSVMTDGEQVQCGAEDLYLTLCRNCYKRAVNGELKFNI